MDSASFHSANVPVSGEATSHQQANCHACVFKAQCLPAELDGEELADFERAVLHPPRPVKAGQVLVRKGDAVHALFALRVGSLKAVINAADGAERVVGFRYPGAVIGLAESGHKVWARTFVTLESAWICRIPIDALNHTLRRQLVHLMSACLRREYDHHLTLAFHTNAQKVASFLLEISEYRQRRHLAAQRFTLPMSNLDIASYLGMRHESLSRTFGTLHSRGLFYKSGKRIHIPDLEALRALRSE